MRGGEIKIFDAIDAVFCLTKPPFDLWFLIAIMASFSEGLPFTSQTLD
ncbi:hypothetical protein ACNHMO_000096 [Staphylococcus pseudintermedius]